MTRITREQFVSDFKRDGSDVPIDVNNLDSSTLEKFKKAGVDVAALRKIAGSDGKINNENEYKELFNKVDSFEKTNPSKDYFDTTTDKNGPSLSGEVYDSLKLEVDRNLNITRAQTVLKNSPNVANTDDHAKHVAKVQADLKKNGMPTSAKGVTVLVMGDEPDHGAAVTRTIAGKVGLAQNADVRFQKSGEFQKKYVDNHPLVKEMTSGTGTLTTTDLAKLNVAQSEAMLYAAHQEIRTARESLPKDGTTRIGNMSWGKSMAGMAGGQAMSVPIGSKIWNDALASVRNSTPRGTAITEVDVRKKIANDIITETKKLQNDPVNENTFNALQASLEKEVAAARKEGLLIFNAAGNERADAKLLGDAKLATVYSDNVKGMITVGAADLKKATGKGADAMWEGSSRGKIEVAAPGVNLPVGVDSSNHAAAMTGTSFASPYAASVAALMIAANPKITPDQIEEILTSGRASMDLRGDRDGSGLLDPVKAVKEAKDLVTKAATKK